MSDINIKLRLELPYEKINEKIKATPEVLKEKCERRISEEIECILMCCECEDEVLTECYYEACSILYNIRACESHLQKLIDIGLSCTQIDVSETVLEGVLKEVNSYFLNAKYARNEKEFDFKKDFLLYVNES